MATETPPAVPVAAVPERADFPVVWVDPADAELTWVWGPDHFPLPFSPLSRDLTEANLRGIHDAHGIRPHERGRALFINGYWYSLRKPKADPNEPVDPRVEERKRRHEALAARLTEAWTREFEPEIRTLCHTIRDRDYESLSAAEIADLLESCFADAGRAQGLTMVAADGMFAAVKPFTDFCKEAFPDQNAEALVGAMLGGFANYTADSEAGVWRLARQAGRLPPVKRALLSDVGDVGTLLRETPAAAAFLGAVDAYLDLYGWRPELWWELTLPVWAEDPRPLYAQIRRYLAEPDADPRRAQRRAWLAGDAEKLARFGDLLTCAQQYVPVRENRAMWQLTATGVVRVPCLALARKLCAAGLLDITEDLFYLSLDEVRRLAHTGCVGISTALDHRALVAERRVERERMLRVIPPVVIGAVDAATRDEIAGQIGRFADLGFQEERGGDDGQTLILRGGAASAGVVRARARVVHTLFEGDKLAPGEVLVCRTTSPAWTSLVARAGAVVADTGGILAHCAIVAREHAIPCVVGTGMATQRIQDGMLVTVDGTRGIVRLDGAADTGDSTGRASAQSPAAAPSKELGTADNDDDIEGVDDRWILWLGEAACHETRRAGGKAANLSRLAAAYRVPPGFCLTAAAYLAARDESGAADSAGGNGSMPEALRRALGDAYVQLAERVGATQPAVAVRSSAIDEDGHAASFAGQHETILNVVGEDALVAAVVRCWRSLHAAGAQAYRAGRGLTNDGARLAVLVQQLVPADAAGVLFTAHPVTGSRDEALLTASYGLGESIVGGAVTPDTYVVRKAGTAGPEIVSLDVGDKEVMTVLAPGGGGGTREVPVPAPLRGRTALEDAQVIEAVRLGMALETEMGWPVDVECAWKDGALYLLQCRPITTLP